MPSYPRSQFLGSSVRNIIHQKGTLLLSLLLFLLPDPVLGSEFVHAPSAPRNGIKLTGYCKCLSLFSQFKPANCGLQQQCVERFSTIQELSCFLKVPNVTRCVSHPDYNNNLPFLLQHVSLTCCFFFLFVFQCDSDSDQEEKVGKGICMGAKIFCWIFWIHFLLIICYLLRVSFWIDPKEPYARKQLCSL